MTDGRTAADHSPEPMMRLAVLDGDGIGPEVVPVAVGLAQEALGRRGVRSEWTTLPFGAQAIASYGEPLPAETLDALTGYELWVVGPHDSASYPPALRAGTPPGGVLRNHGGMYANLRPAQALPGVTATAPDIDLLIVRENSEGLYADRNMAVGSGEFMPTPDIALSVGMITRAATERIARQAFEAARSRRRPGRRPRVTVVHKANVLRLSTGLFRDVCFEVAADYPDVDVDDQHVDAMAALLVRRPADFDVIVTENLFGDILSDLAAELSGSLGLAASINCSASRAMAQAVHGAAPDIAGRGVADPVAMIGSVVLLLQWQAARTGDRRIDEAASAVTAAVHATLGAGIATADIGGSASTAVFAEAVHARLDR
ncbi:isocitrate/isopropylmalate dehydrogenase family protein [Gordonia sp. VNK21]|uniref:isocitrate/isopropylmalate dehydrogenase family protein n=1 Tax=Gordonia sp. VNK21 TaxID=3382483 RepID=UPI0038D39C33